MANTGRIRYREIDVNPNSPTVGQQRWSEYEVNEAACPITPTFYSEVISEPVSRNNCGQGLYGTEVIYTVPAGAYTSNTSQQDANAQARDYFEATKQAYANQNGGCTATPPVAFEPLYYTGPLAGCFACTMVNPNNANDTRSATGEEIQQYYVVTSAAGRTCPIC